MVVRDLSFSETQPPRNYKPSTPATVQLPLAPVTDRFIAFILDFLVLSPVVSFCVAGILRNLKTVLLLNSESEEAVVIWALFVAGIVCVSSLVQAFFIYFWQATPGQKFLQLEVVSYPQALSDHRKLTFAQSFLRPMGWWFGFLLMGVPFLEILGHPLRRAFHERVSDTLVLSHKHEPVDLPLAVETRYISSTLWIFFGFMFVMGLALMGKAYKAAVLEGLNGKKTVSQAYCPSIPTDRYQGQKRLDVALAMYLADETDDACVYTEAQKAVWALEGEDKALGNLAMAVISEDDKEAAAYQDLVCTGSEKSEACAISNYLKSKDKDKGNILRRAGLGLVSSRLLLLKDSMEQKNYASAVGLIKDLETESPLVGFLNKNLVKAAWILNAQATQKNSRVPASADEKQILQEFKKRYEIE